MLYLPAHRPCASAETHGLHSSLSGPRFSPLEKRSHPVSGGASWQSCVTHLSVHRCIALRVVRSVSVTGGGGTVARDSHISPHKRAGTSHCVESDPTFRSSAAESTCSDSHRQQSDGSLHKPAGRSPFHSAAEHSQTAAALGTHTLTLHQSSVYSRCIEQRSGHYVERRPSTGRSEPPSRPGHPYLEQVRQSRGGSVCHTRKRAVRSLVLTEHTRQSSAGSGRVCVSAMLLYAFPPVPLIPRFLDRVQEEQLSAILIALERTGASWFPCLQRLISGRQWELPRRGDALSQAE